MQFQFRYWSLNSLASICNVKTRNTISIKLVLIISLNAFSQARPSMSMNVRNILYQNIIDEVTITLIGVCTEAVQNKTFACCYQNTRQNNYS